MILQSTVNYVLVFSKKIVFVSNNYHDFQSTVNYEDFLAMMTRLQVLTILAYLEQYLSLARGPFGIQA